MSAPQYGRPSRRPRPQEAQRRSASPHPPDPLSQAREPAPGPAVPRRDDTSRPIDGSDPSPPRR